MLSVEAEAEFLDRVYEAALDPLLWEPLIVRFCDLMGGDSANLIWQDEITGEGHAFPARCDPDSFGPYFGYFAKRNPLLRITDRPLGLRVLTDEQKLPKSELERTEYYNDFMRPYDIHSLMIARLALERSNSVCINLTRARHRDAFGRTELEDANRLLPHLVRSYRLSTKLAASRRLHDGMRELADLSRHAIFLVDAHARLHHANRAGEIMLAKDGALSASGNVLRAAQVDATRTLHALIGRAAEPDGERRTGGDMMLTRSENEKPLFVSVAPVRGERASILHPEAMVLVSVHDPDAYIPISERRLRDRLALSRTEARLAVKLLEGCSPREAAEQLGISYYTVRGHLARMFDKTGTRRQSELVKLMLLAGADTNLHA